MESIHTLLSRIIDYAGLFPPAKLDLATTVRNYASYLKSDDAWMLGRLIMPVARLDEFEQLAAELLPRDDEAGELWQISALTSPADAPELEADLARIEAFNEKHANAAAGLANIDVIELKVSSAAAIDRAMEHISSELFPFFELPIDSDPRGLIAALADSDAGAKVRTGGVTADLYPKTHDLARFIAACAAAGVPFKATAGLHHPLRHHSSLVQTDEFGFLNVFMAGSLALTHELPEEELAELLEERSIEAFAFDDAGITWREHRIRTENIEDVREEFAVSFGSCSFDEPREDLRALKLL